MERFPHWDHSQMCVSVCVQVKVPRLLCVSPTGKKNVRIPETLDPHRAFDAQQSFFCSLHQHQPLFCNAVKSLKRAYLLVSSSSLILSWRSSATCDASPLAFHAFAQIKRHFPTQKMWMSKLNKYYRETHSHCRNKSASQSSPRAVLGFTVSRRATSGICSVLPSPCN